MGRKKLEQDLRDAGLRKKRARKVVKAADRGRAGDRAARKLVEQQSAALRDSLSAVVSHAKPPPRSRSTKKASPKKSSARRTSTKRARARRSTSKSAARKAPASTRKASAKKS